MTRVTRKRFERQHVAVAAPPEFKFPTGGPYPMRLALGMAKNYQTYTVELMVGGFTNEAAAQEWAQTLQTMLERYAGANTGPTN